MNRFSAPRRTIETTFGELVEAVAQAALDSNESEQDCYTLASLTLSRLLQDQKNQLITALTE